MSEKLPATALQLPLGNIESYIQRAQQIPMLSAEDEHRFALKFYEEQDLDAARQLIMAHLRFVVKTARGYLGYGLPMSDLIQEGTIGLMKAVKRFDPHMGVRLVTFAVHWIKAEIHEYVLRNWRIVKVATTKAQRKLFFNLRKASQTLGWLSKEEIASVAEELNVKPEEVQQMEARLQAHDMAFDGLNSDDDDAAQLAPAQYLTDGSNDPALTLEQIDSSTQENTALYEALGELDDRSRDILQQRWLSEDKATLHQLAAQYGISAERVRQLENNAMKKLRAAIAA